MSFTLPFTKMQGAGNDVIVLNAMHGLPVLRSEHFCALGDRRYGIGCDQILIVAPPQNPANDFSYRIANNDGSEVEHCGNGARCFMRYVREMGLTQKRQVRVEIATGVIILIEHESGEIEVNMGPPRFDAVSLPFIPIGLTHTEMPNGHQVFELNVDNTRLQIGIVSVGNPHAVQLVTDIDAAPVTTQGPAIELHPAFPNRVNVPYVQVLDRNTIKLRVWERGAGETLACGTGTCAAVVSAISRGVVDSPVRVLARGGELHIVWAGAGSDVMMRGPAVTVFTGSITLND